MQDDSGAPLLRRGGAFLGPDLGWHVPLVHWPGERHRRWLLLFLVAAALPAGWISIRSDDQSFPLLWLYLGLSMYLQDPPSLSAVTGGVYATNYRTQVTRVPLAAAELQPLPKELRLRWPEGRIMRAIAVTLPAAFREDLAAATASAHAAAPGAVPRTVAEAAQAVTFGFPGSRTLGALCWLAGLGLLGLAIWLRLPLILLAVPPAIWLASRQDDRRLVILSLDHLWILAQGKDAYPIPLAAVRGVNCGRWTSEIHTRDPVCPSIRLRGAASTDLIRQLERRLAGGPAFVPDEAVAGARTEGARPGPRCTLCGSRDSDADHDAAPAVPVRGGVTGTAHICARCAGKIRFEAAEAGHGLTGKPPKPL